MNPTSLYFFHEALEIGIVFLLYVTLPIFRILRPVEWNMLMDWEWGPLKKTGFYDWRSSKTLKTFSKGRVHLIITSLLAGFLLLLTLLNIATGIYFSFKLEAS